MDLNSQSAKPKPKMIKLRKIPDSCAETRLWEETNQYTLCLKTLYKNIHPKSLSNN